MVVGFLSLFLWVTGLLKSETVELYLNWKWEPQFGGFAACHLRGLDEKLGFQLKIIPGGATSSTILLVHNRKAPLAIVSGDELVLAHSRGQQDLVALMAVFQDNPQIIMLRKDPKISHLKDLLGNENYTIFWQEGLPYAQFLLKQYSVKAKRRPYFGGVGVLLQQKNVAMQGFETSEPFLIPSNIEVQIFPIRQEGFNPYTTVVITHRDLWQKDPNQVKRWWKCLVKGWQAYLQDPTVENDFMLKENPALNKDFLFKSAQVQKSLIAPSGLPFVGYMKADRWQTLVKQMVAAQLLPKPIDVQKLFISELQDPKALGDDKP